MKKIDFNNAQKKSGGTGQKRFLINALVLAAACVLVIFKLPSWGVAQVIVLLLLAVLAAFQLVLYFKLR